MQPVKPRIEAESRVNGGLLGGNPGSGGRQPGPSVADVWLAILTGTYKRKLKSRFWFWSISGRFSAKVGPGTVTEGSALTNAA